MIIRRALIVAALCLAAGLATHGEDPVPPAPAQRTLFDFREELGLSDAQVAEIKRVLAELAKQVKLGQAKGTVLNYEIEDLIQREGDLAEIRAKMQEEANLRVTLRLADVTAAREINRVLTPQQLARWRELQARR